MESGFGRENEVTMVQGVNKHFDSLQGLNSIALLITKQDYRIVERI